MASMHLVPQWTHALRTFLLSLSLFLSSTDRSPINKAGNITAPLLLLQGDIDKVVPPAQSSDMLEKIRANGGVCEMELYKGEGHGFRGREAQENCLKRMLGWYRKTWGLKGPAEDELVK